MLDYKNIIIKRYALNLSFRELAEEFGASRSGVNDFCVVFITKWASHLLSSPLSPFMGSLYFIISNTVNKPNCIFLSFYTYNFKKKQVLPCDCAN